MRNIKTIKIDDKEITVQELRVKDIRTLLDEAQGLSSLDISILQGKADELFPMATTLAPSEIDDMAPSELLQVWEAFREVNAPFFGLLNRSGLIEAAKRNIAQAVRQTLTIPSVSSSPGGTENPGNTGGDGS